MPTPIAADGPGSALVPVTNIPPVTGSAEVVGTVGMVDGELVVRIKPTQYRDVTGRRLGPDPDVEVDVKQHPLARLGLRYVGPLTPEQAARFRAEVARWDAPLWWRRWATDFVDWCWRWRR
jgi:DNA-binding transcriptional LysR family regulator